MAAIQAPVSHLRENPFEIAREQLRLVADAFDIDQNLVNILQECKKAVEVAIPVSETGAAVCTTLVDLLGELVPADEAAPLASAAP